MCLLRTSPIDVNAAKNVVSLVVVVHDIDVAVAAATCKSISSAGQADRLAGTRAGQVTDSVA